MAGPTEPLKIDGQDWSRILKGMHKANDDLRKQFRSDLRKKYLTPLKKDQIKELERRNDIPRTMRGAMARSLGVEVREKTTRSQKNGTAFADARIRMSANKFAAALPGTVESRNVKSARRIAKYANRGGWRHPVYARPDVPREQWTWVKQDVQPGWFDDPFKANEKAILGFIQQTFDEWRRRYQHSGFGF